MSRSRRVQVLGVENQKPHLDSVQGYREKESRIGKEDVLMKTYMLALFFLASSNSAVEEPREKIIYSEVKIVHFDLQAQGRCESMCFTCIASGQESEDCAAQLSFQLCCRIAGGHTNGCGCREGL